MDAPTSSPDQGSGPGLPPGPTPGPSGRPPTPEPTPEPKLEPAPEPTLEPSLVRSVEPIVERLRAGDEAAFEEVVRVHGGRMLQVARRLLDNEEDARDAVQEAFASAFRAIGSFEGGARLATWLHRIVVNASLGKLRRRRRKPDVSIEALLPRYLEDGHAIDPPQPWRSEPDRLVAAELGEKVREGIGRLPETYRTVIILRDIEGLDTEETARLLDATPTAVKVRLHRARQALRAILDPYLREAAAG